VEGDEVVERIEDLACQDQLTTLYAERAVSFIDRHTDEPFFLYLAHSMPHVPLGVSDKFRGESEQGMYGDVIQEIDWSVGQVMEALDRHGLTENTLVIFTSDNGPWLNFGNHAGSTGGLREGKGTAFEGGPRVPGIMRWPGHIPAGEVVSRMASTLDVLPTVAAITGAALPERKIDGVNLLPMLEGDANANPRNHFFFYYTGELRGVREGKWKRVYEHRTRSYVGVEPGMDGLPGPYANPTVPTALYDLDNDVGETTDVSAQHPDIVRRLDELAEVARATLGDRLTGRVGSEVRPIGRRGFDRVASLDHLAVGATVTLTTPASSYYPGSGAPTLTDGAVGSRDHHDARWLGFSGDDLEAVVDLGAPRSVRRIGLDCLQNQGAWIFFPPSVEFAVSVDGRSWETVGLAEVELEVDPATASRMIEVEVGSPPAGAGGEAPRTPVRYVRVRARNLRTVPDWHPGAGGEAWLFVDEIVVEG
jgi:hypothetical protein